MQNFGKIKNTFNGILAESMFSKDNTNKLLFKKYIKTIKESNILKTQFLVYDNIENRIEENEFKATEFIKANIALMNKFDKKAILEANLALSKPVLFEQRESSYSKEKLHEDITTLIFTESTPSTIDTIMEATANIVSYMKSNKVKAVSEAIELPSSMISTMMVDKYNEKYADLSESDKNIIRTLIDSTDEQKKEVYTQTLKECIELVDSQLANDSVRGKSEVYEKLLNVKNKLLNDKVEITEDFEKKISKLVDLKESLK